MTEGACRGKLLFLVLLVFSAGCMSGRRRLVSPGLLYTNTIRPHSTNFRNTSVGTKSCVLNEYKLKEPVTGYDVSAEWSTKTIIAAAKEAGITNIAYTEMHTLSILGIYRQKSLIIHGD